MLDKFSFKLIFPTDGLHCKYAGSGRILKINDMTVVIERKSLFSEKIQQTDMSDVQADLVNNLVCGVTCFSILVFTLIFIVQRHGKGKHVDIDGKWEYMLETDYGF